MLQTFGGFANIEGEVLGSEGEYSFIQMMLRQIHEGQAFLYKGGMHVLGLGNEQCMLHKQTDLSLLRKCPSLQLFRRLPEERRLMSEW